MRIYFLVVALLLPQLILAQNGMARNRFNRRAARRLASAPRRPLSRFSRFIQDEQPDVQQKSTEDADIEPDLQELVDAFNAGQEKPTTKAFGGNNAPYTQMPQLYETSTPRTMQLKGIDEENEDISSLSQPLAEFEDLAQQLQQPSQDLSYMPKKGYGETSNAYGPTNGNGKNGYAAKSNGNGATNGYAGENGSRRGYGAINGNGLNGNGFGLNGGAGAAVAGDLADHDGNDFGSGEEDHNTVDWLRGSVRGEPGTDYPVFSTVPETGFKCGDQELPGYYADVDAQCQVFHICQPDGRANAFLCPNGTIFSQRHFVCVWWFDFDCATAPQFYGLNAELYKEVEGKPADGALSGAVAAGPATSGPLMGGSVPSYGGSANGFGGASTEATTLGYGNGRLSSPKQNLNKMYKSQIDEFGTNDGVTTSMPNYYTNGKTTMKLTNGYKTTNGVTSGSNGGYSPSPSGSYSPSPNGYSSSPNGYSPSPNGYSPSPNGYSPSPNGYSPSPSSSVSYSPSPNGYSPSSNGNGYSPRPNGNGYSGGYKPTTMAAKYDAASPAADSVTPSPVEGYETTPYNLDAALGEEIHSETPLIESLPLTTILPHMEEMEFGPENGEGAPDADIGVKPSNGNGYLDFLASKYATSPKPLTSAAADYGYSTKKNGYSNGVSPKPMYGGGVKGGKSKTNGKSNGKMAQLPESPAKNGKNGGGMKGSNKMSYGGKGNGFKLNGNMNGFKSTYAPYGNGLKQK